MAGHAEDPQEMPPTAMDTTNTINRVPRPGVAGGLLHCLEATDFVDNSLGVRFGRGVNRLKRPRCGGAGAGRGVLRERTQIPPGTLCLDCRCITYTERRREGRHPRGRASEEENRGAVDKSDALNHVWF